VLAVRTAARHSVRKGEGEMATWFYISSWDGVSGHGDGADFLQTQ
jgi:hypothetical protein